MRRLPGFVVLVPSLCLAANGSFEKTVLPFLNANFVLCHNSKMRVGGISLDAYTDSKAALKDRDLWEKVVQKVRTGQMPPGGRPLPPPEDVTAVTRWFDAQFARLD